MAVASLQRPGAGGRVVFFWICVQEVQGRRAACRSGKPDACHRWGGCSIAQGPLWVGSALEVSVVAEVPPPPDQDAAGRSLFLFAVPAASLDNQTLRAEGPQPTTPAFLCVPSMVLPSFDLNTSGDRGLTTQGSAPFIFWVAGSHFLPRESQFLPTLIREHSECPQSAWKWSRLAQPSPRMVWTRACPHIQISPGLHLGQLTSQCRPCGSTRPGAVFLGVGHCPCPIPEVWEPQGRASSHKGPLPADPCPCIPSQQPARPSTWTAPSQVGPTLLWQLLPASPHPHFLLWVLVEGSGLGLGSGSAGGHGSCVAFVNLC